MNPKAIEAAIRLRGQARTLAPYNAKNRVKEELRKHNVKLQSLSSRDLALWADLYLSDHREEMLASALRIVAESSDCKAR
jgi:hypothetical protein